MCEGRGIGAARERMQQRVTLVFCVTELRGSKLFR